MKTRKLVCLLACLCLVLGALPAWAGDVPEILGNEPLTITWYVNYDWYVALPWAVEHDGEAWVKEQTQVDVQFMDAGGAAKQKLSTMIVDDQFPDVLTLDRGQDMDKLIANGKLVALDEYVDQYPNLKKWIGEGTLNMLRAADGKLYGFPNWAIGPGRANGNGGWFVDKLVYEALGSPEISTFDQLYAFLKEVKEAYPDMVPMEGGVNLDCASVVYTGQKAGLLSNYLGYRAVPKEGKLTSIFEDEYFQSAYLFMNKLYTEGLLSQDVFTQNKDQRNEKLMTGRVALYGGNDSIDASANTRNALRGVNPEDDWVYLAPIHAEGEPVDKIFNNCCTTLGWNMNCITKDAENPEAIYAFMDYLFGADGQRALTYGRPGVYYEEGDYTQEGFPVSLKQAYYDATDEQRTALWSNNNWVGNTSYTDGQGEYFMMKDPASAAWEKHQQINVVWKHSAVADQFSNLTPDSTTEMGIIYQQMEDLWKEAVAEIVMAPTPEEAQAQIAAYSEAADAIGYQDLLAWQTEIYRDNCERLGIEP